MSLYGSAVPAHAPTILYRKADPVGVRTRTSPRRSTTGTGHQPGRGDWSGRYTVLLAAADSVTALLGWLVALEVTQLVHGTSMAAPWTLVGVAGWVLLVFLGRGYERSRVGAGSDEMRAVLRAGGHATVLAALLTAWLQDLPLLLTMVVAALVTPLGGLLARMLLRRWLHRRQRAGLDLRDTVVVGPLSHVEQLADQLADEPHAGMRVVGVCVPEHEAEDARRAGLVVLGDTGDVRDVVLRHGAAVVAVTSGQPPHYLRQLAWSLEGMGTQLVVSPGLVEVAGPRLHIRPFIGLPLLAIEQPHFSGWRVSAKRVSDVVLASLGMLVAGPVMLVLAAAVKLGDGGPVFFSQTRVGLNGRTFTMYKFRSMHVDAEARLAELVAANEGAGPLFKMADDPRITKVGKFLRRTSLDELPQLFNVLNGTMSLVGPRPPLPSEVAEYQVPVRRRLLVVPGLTGLWQVSGRSSLSWDESVRLDLRYVENWTFALDLLILWRTAWAVLARRGAY